MYSKIRYGYKYVEGLDIYIVRRIDGKTLNYYLPINVIKRIILDEINKKEKITINGSIKKNICFNSNCHNAIVDFNGRTFSEKQVDEIIDLINGKYNKKKEEEEKKEKRIKKVLSIFKNK